MLPRAHFSENIGNKAHFKNIVLSKLAWCTRASSVTQVGKKVNKKCIGKPCILFIGHKGRNWLSGE